MARIRRQSQFRGRAHGLARLEYVVKGGEAALCNKLDWSDHPAAAHHPFLRTLRRLLRAQARAILVHSQNVLFLVVLW